MKTFEYKDQWGGVTRVRLVRGAYADGSLAVQMLCEGDGCWEPYATLTVNLCDARSQNASYAYVDTNNLPTAADFLVENGLATYTGMTRPSNAKLEAHGIEERIDHRSNAESDIGLLPTIHEGYAVRAIEDRAKREAEEEGREYVPVTERRRINEARRAINRRLRKIMDEIRQIVLSRLERARSQQRKRTSQRTVGRTKPRQKKAYAPQRGRRTSPSGGLSK